MQLWLCGFLHSPCGRAVGDRPRPGRGGKLLEVPQRDIIAATRRKGAERVEGGSCGSYVFVGEPRVLYEQHVFTSPGTSGS